MAIIATFTPVSMTAAQYDDILRRLAASGEGRPAGRLYHVCSGTGSSLGVVDVWDSAASFEAFGRTLMPILQQVGVDVGQPRVSEVHNLIPG